MADNKSIFTDGSRKSQNNGNQGSQNNDAVLAGLDDAGIFADIVQVEESDSQNTGRGRQGFASMSQEKQRQIASKGGRAAHEQGTAHEWDSEEARAAGRKGGQSRSKTAG